MKAYAIANNDIAFVAWNYGKKIPGCLGFAIYRIDLNSRISTTLPSWVGFTGQSNKYWERKSTEEWPIQKFNWRDLTARRGGFYQYKIVPMVGEVGKLRPRARLAVTSNPIHLTGDRGNISAYFNRGILASQFLTHQIPKGPSGGPNYVKLDERIDQPGDPLRERLSGDLRFALMKLLERARREGGNCYCALYELSDPELEQTLLGAPFVHLVLSNTGTDDATNVSGRQALHESHTDVTDRMLPNGHIGHNKFVVYVDNTGKPRAVLTGSANWTPTAICGQTNNSLILESDKLAAFYFDYWKRLKKDTEGAGEANGGLQSADYRQTNNRRHEATLDSGNTKVTLWFSPNTRQKNKPAGQKATTPSDMKEVFDIMDGAKSAILFLAFMPGTPSIMDKLEDCQIKNPNLFIHGAMTDDKAVDRYHVDLYHRNGTKPDAKVVAAAAINDQFAFWQKELLKSSPQAHAIIHDKIVVVDPLSSDCTVITGSHNLGYRASYNNDENMLIIRGNRAVAESYAAHVMDVYEHYRFRYALQRKKSKAWQGLSRRDDWQDRYFDPNSSARKEIEFWTSAPF